MSGWIQAGTGVGQMGMNAGATYAEATAYNLALRYNKHIALRNKNLALYQARESIYLGEVAAAQYQRQVTSLVGTQRAAAASSGVLVGAGSAGDATSFARATGERGVQTIRRNAAKTAWAHTVEAANQQSQWNILRTAKRSVWSATLGGALGGSGAATEGIGTLISR